MSHLAQLLVRKKSVLQRAISCCRGAAPTCMAAQSSPLQQLGQARGHSFALNYFQEQTPVQSKHTANWLSQLLECLFQVKKRECTEVILTFVSLTSQLHWDKYLCLRP